MSDNDLLEQMRARVKPLNRAHRQYRDVLLGWKSYTPGAFRRAVSDAQRHLAQQYRAVSGQGYFCPAIDTAMLARADELEDSAEYHAHRVNREDKP